MNTGYYLGSRSESEIWEKVYIARENRTVKIPIQHLSAVMTMVAPEVHAVVQQLSRVLHLRNTGNTPGRPRNTFDPSGRFKSLLRWGRS